MASTVLDGRAPCPACHRSVPLAHGRLSRHHNLNTASMLQRPGAVCAASGLEPTDHVVIAVLPAEPEHRERADLA